MSTRQKIAIIGATGMIGSPVTAALIDQGHDVTIITRSPKIAALQFPTARIAHGDLRDAESLLRHIDGQDIVHLNLSIAPGTNPWEFVSERDGISTVIDCARIAGTPRLSYVSSLLQRIQGHKKFDWWVFRVKSAAIEAIKKSGIPYIIFYPSTFMENIDQGPLIQKNRIIVPAIRQRGSYYIAGRDFGNQVSTAFTLDLPENAEFVIQGPDRLIPMVTARQFAAHYPHQTLIPTRIPMWVIRLAGIVNPRIHYFERMVTAIGEFEETFLAQSTWKTLGTPEITVAQYAKTHARIIT